MNLKKWNALNAEQKRALEDGSKAFLSTPSTSPPTAPRTTSGRVHDECRHSGHRHEPDIAAFRKATLPVVQAFKARVKSPLVDKALKEAGIQ